MVRAARPGGTIAVLDYDYTRAEWDPPMPPTVHRFYQSFLDWRADAGMNNAIAAHLPLLFEQAGLTGITAVDQHEVTTVRAADYQRRIALWPGVIATRGHQVVADGWLTEADRALAEEDIRRWIKKAFPYGGVGQKTSVRMRIASRAVAGRVDAVRGVPGVGGSFIGEIDR